MYDLAPKTEVWVEIPQDDSLAEHAQAQRDEFLAHTNARDEDENIDVDMLQENGTWCFLMEPLPNTDLTHEMVLIDSEYLKAVWKLANGKMKGKCAYKDVWGHLPLEASLPYDPDPA